MSASVDRLNELEAQTAPLPWPAEDFFDMPDDQFQMLVALQQAWPHLRDEIGQLEATVVALSKESTQLHREHERITAGSAALARSLETVTVTLARERAEARDYIERLEKELDTANEKVRNLPLAAAAADAVCRSLDQARKGSGGAFGHYDGEAYDAWKRAAQ